MANWLRLASFVILGALFTAAEGRPSLAIASSGNALTSRAPSTNKTVIIQMFEWTWDSVASECTNFIGPAGYGFVQGRSHVSLDFDSVALNSRHEL